MDCSPSGSSVHGILQARILEWVAMPSFRASFRPRDWTQVSYFSCIGGGVPFGGGGDGGLVTKLCPTLVTPGTAALQTPLSMGFSRQESWSGLPCPLPGELPDPGVERTSLTSPILAGGFSSTGAPWECLVLSQKIGLKQRCFAAQIPVCRR